jgi:BirA family biotin operon repressor/biotin-[acetyl-CoA-carboxylase] ligase
VGIGLNLTTAPADFPPELRQTATSLGVAAGVAGPAPEEALGALVAALERRLATPRMELLDAWRARDALRGLPVRWDDGEGVAAGIDDTGALLVDTGSYERVALDAGEVHLLR